MSFEISTLETYDKADFTLYNQEICGKLNNRTYNPSSKDHKDLHQMFRKHCVDKNEARVQLVSDVLAMTTTVYVDIEADTDGKAKVEAGADVSSVSCPSGATTTTNGYPLHL